MDVGAGRSSLQGVVKSFDGFVNAVDGVNIKIPERPIAACLVRPAAARPRSCA